MLSLIGFFVTGLTLTLMPCSAFLIPIVLYRYSISSRNTNNNKRSKHSKIPLIQFVLGFALGFILVSLLILILGNNPWALSVKLVLAIFFIVLGTVSFKKPISWGFSTQFNAKLDILFGFLIPIVLIFSPCGLPLFSYVVFSKNILGLLVLGLGSIFPYLFFAVFSVSLSKLLNKIVKFTYLLEKFSWLLFLLTGIYGLFSLGRFTHNDLLIMAIIGLLLSLFILFKRIKNKGSSIGLANILGFVLFIVLWILIFYFCSLHMPKDLLPQLSCSSTGVVCPYCLTCYIVFLVGSVLTGILYEFSAKLRLKVKRF